MVQVTAAPLVTVVTLMVRAVSDVAPQVDVVYPAVPEVVTGAGQAVGTVTRSLPCVVPPVGAVKTNTSELAGDVAESEWMAGVSTSVPPLAAVTATSGELVSARGESGGADASWAVKTSAEPVRAAGGAVASE